MKKKKNESHIEKIEAICRKYGLKVIREQGSGFFIMSSQKPIKSNDKKE